MFVSSFSNQCSESVSILDCCRDFNGTGDVIVVMAQLVGQELNLVRTLASRIFNDGELGRHVEALLGSDRDQVKLVVVSVSDSAVYNSTWERISEVTNITAEETSVNSLVYVEVDKFGFASSFCSARFELSDFKSANGLDLRVGDTVPVHNNARR